MIHLDSPDEIYSKNVVWIWLVAAFKAGFINSAGFLATGKFVSHVTGFGTQVGFAVGLEDFLFGAELLIIPGSFIFGGVVTSLILDRHYDRGQTPPYYQVQALITVFIGFVILLGEHGDLIYSFNAQSPKEHNLAEFLVISLLCFICGLKNALVTWTTKGKIRVTHLTGISTDIGLNLVRSLSFKQPSPMFHEKKIVNIIRILTLAAFSSGAIISALVFPRVGYKGFFLVMAISVVITVVSLIDYRKRKQKSETQPSLA